MPMAAEITPPQPRLANAEQPPDQPGETQQDQEVGHEPDEDLANHAGLSGPYSAG